MSAVLSGPIFEPSDNGLFKSVHGKSGAHYNIFSVSDGMRALREFFPDGKCNELNIVFFSTSGVQGSYATIEEVAANKEGKDGLDEVTFLIVQPRIVCLRYGNCKPTTKTDIAFLKKLRRSSCKVAQEIGKP